MSPKITVEDSNDNFREYYVNLIARIMAKVKYMNIGNKIWYFFLDKDGFIDVRKIGDISEMMRK